MTSLLLHAAMSTCVHTLVNGASVLGLSPHGFRFSDGTESKPAPKELVDAFNLKRVTQKVGEIKGMEVNSMQMVLTTEQLIDLGELADLFDIVIVPFPVLTALRDLGKEQRDLYPNVVAMNATVETQRSAPNDKVVDINNWSY